MNYLFFFQEATLSPFDKLTSSIVFPVFILVILVALLAIVLSAFNMLQNPAGIKNFAISLVALLIIFFIGFAISGGDVPDSLKDVTSSGTYKWVGAGIFVTLALMLVGFLFLFVDLVRGMFKI